MTETNSDRDVIGSVLGRTPSGIFVATAGNAAGQETGMLASWVQQASFEPPMVTVAVNRSRYLNDWLAEKPQIVLNLIGESQKQFLGHFGQGFEPGEAAFDGLKINRGQTGLPILSDALGFLEGNIVSRLETGDHMIYAVQLVGAGAGADLASRKPMVHIRKNGFNY